MYNGVCPKCGTMVRLVQLNFGVVGKQCMNGLCGWKDYEVKISYSDNTGPVTRGL